MVLIASSCVKWSGISECDVCRTGGKCCLRMNLLGMFVTVPAGAQLCEKVALFACAVMYSSVWQREREVFEVG